MIHTSKYEYGQPVTVNFSHNAPNPAEPQVRAKIKAVYFNPNVKYDLEIKTFGEKKTVIRGIDECYVHALSGSDPEIDSYLIDGWKK